MTDDEEIISTTQSHVAGACPDDEEMISTKQSMCYQWAQCQPPRVRAGPLEITLDCMQHTDTISMLTTYAVQGCLKARASRGAALCSSNLDEVTLHTS